MSEQMHQDMETPLTPVESGTERMHTWWELSYSNYLTIPRLIIQSMPDDWQGRFCDMLDEAHDLLAQKGIEWPPKGHSITVQLRHDETGRFVDDDFARYERGRRRLWRNDDIRGSDQHLERPAGDAVPN